MADEYTISETAKMLKVDRATVWKWLKAGKFPDFRKTGLGKTAAYAISGKSVKMIAEQLGVSLENG
ncbi:MAG: helix-turn-helix domain-containing protein [Anaerolinea sp.]|nr:helix-turn-helix domain-containing protein [Anaerolinea sp.]